MSDIIDVRKKIITGDTFYNQQFDALDLRDQELQSKEFEACTFTECNFSQASFLQCKFIDCYFQSSNLSLLKLIASSFSEVEFDACKMTGINWTQLHWPSVILSDLISFKGCDVSHSSFFELSLPELSMTDCRACDVDFRGCDLNKAILTGTDFEQAQFMHTQLRKANLSGAYNYNMSPVDNMLEGAKFSFPEVAGLLSAFGIIIEGL